MPPSPTADSCVAFLVRHGATPNNEASPPLLQGCGADPGLSPNPERTRRNARSRLLANVPLAAIYSSPLLRALQTAERIARPHGLVVKQIAALHEADVGRWESRSWLEIEQIRTGGSSTVHGRWRHVRISGRGEHGSAARSRRPESWSKLMRAHLGPADRGGRAQRDPSSVCREPARHSAEGCPSRDTR